LEALEYYPIVSGKRIQSTHRRLGWKNLVIEQGREARVQSGDSEIESARNRVGVTAQRGMFFKTPKEKERIARIHIQQLFGILE